MGWKICPGKVVENSGQTACLKEIRAKSEYGLTASDFRSILFNKICVSVANFMVKGVFSQNFLSLADFRSKFHLCQHYFHCFSLFLPQPVNFSTAKGGGGVMSSHEPPLVVPDRGLTNRM